MEDTREIEFKLFKDILFKGIINAVADDNVHSLKNLFDLDDELGQKIGELQVLLKDIGCMIDKVAKEIIDE